MDDGRGTTPDADGALAMADAERTKQLHEARGALAEAVTTLSVELSERRTELDVRRREVEALRTERDAAVSDNRALREEVEKERVRIRNLEGALTEARELVITIQSTKVMRWSAPARRLVYAVRQRQR